MPGRQRLAAFFVALHDQQRLSPGFSTSTRSRRSTCRLSTVFAGELRLPVQMVAYLTVGLLDDDRAVSLLTPRVDDASPRPALPSPAHAGRQARADARSAVRGARWIDAAAGRKIFDHPDMELRYPSFVGGGRVCCRVGLGGRPDRRACSGWRHAVKRASGRAFARAGLLGNPSDGYGGKAIAVALTQLPRLRDARGSSPRLEIVPGTTRPVESSTTLASASRLSLSKRGFDDGGRACCAPSDAALHRYVRLIWLLEAGFRSARVFFACASRTDMSRSKSGSRDRAPSSSLRSCAH